MQTTTQAPATTTEKTDSISLAQLEDYTRLMITLAVFRFNSETLDTLDEWEIRGEVQSLNNLRQKFGLEPFRHNLDEEQDEDNPAPELDPFYWDCECEENFIHRKTTRLECPVCKAHAENQPDSRVNEVATCLNFYINEG